MANPKDTTGNEVMIATVEVPMQKNQWGAGSIELYAKFPKYRKWWKFWIDNYEERPLKIVDLKNYTLIK